MKKILGNDPVTRTQRKFHSHVDEEFAIETKQDVSEIVKLNKYERVESDGHFNLDGQTHVARIPNNIFWDLHRRGIVQDDEKFKEWLNDPDNRAFRTHPGSI